ncbi:MAG: hypothetical protein ACE3K2_01550 [Paenibacillus sp.]|uniref:hypothetical protein n=1 Tax=Paenibacillus sp. TaxID=58172 RepID=UPI003B76262A
MPVKYLGWLVEIIYEDKSGEITNYRIQVKSNDPNLLRQTTFCQACHVKSDIGLLALIPLENNIGGMTDVK